MAWCQVADNGTSKAPDAFLEQCRRDCAIQRNTVVCDKYRAVRWINDLVQQQEFTYGPFKIIKIPAMQTERFLPELPSDPSKKRSAVANALHFVREAAEDLMTRRALVYTVEQESGARALNSGAGILIMDDEELGRARQARTFDLSPANYRIFKKKKNIILPILILLNLIKLKLLILPIFLGVHFIKKLLVLGSLLLPSILAHLKICKVAQPSYHHYHPWAASAEYPVDYPSAYGHEDAWDHRNDVASNAYGNYYSNSFYNPFAHYFQNYNKQQR
ncbi:uncharacterized protein LOC106642563 [Copidosoma floridanum]|uniref:uncharacterized protein LOC106642563 n=1 Tax=Copidosoma floridanum TaxID=29053 RepID=UPI0006C97ED8|nr:uncharacterized protein LOC106642563 [Copidosoma floridanum]